MITSLVMAIGGLAAAPFLVDVTHDFIEDAPEWFPFVVILAVSAILYAVARALRWTAAGLFLGVLAFGGILASEPSWIDWLPRNVNVPAPF